MAAVIAACGASDRPPGPMWVVNDSGKDLVVQLTGEARESYLVAAGATRELVLTMNGETVSEGVVLDEQCQVIMTVEFGGRSDGFDLGGYFHVDAGGGGYGSPAPALAGPPAAITDRCGVKLVSRAYQDTAGTARTTTHTYTGAGSAWTATDTAGTISATS